MAAGVETVTQDGGFGLTQALICLWTWLALVLAYAFYRSGGDASPDPIEPAGPFQDEK